MSTLVTRNVLLALDVDGCLAERPARVGQSSLRGWSFAKRREFALANWRALVETGQLDPITVALQALQALEEMPPTVIVTSREECLRPATMLWLWRHFSMLRGAELLMRPMGDDRPGYLVKRDWIDQVREGRRVVLVDDERISSLAVRRGDTFIRAPDGWSMVGAAVTEPAVHGTELT